MNRNAVRVVTVCAMVVILASLGCATSEGNDESTETAVSSDTLRPVKIAVFVDKSGSTRANGIDQPAVEELIPLIDLLGEVGGELAVGRIADRSNVPLARLAISPPPVEPDRPREDANPFDVADRMERYQIDMTQYRAQMEEWTDDALSRAEAFVAAVRPVFEAPPDSNRTDIWSAVGRGSRFLQEPTGNGSLEPTRFLIMCTDGINNVEEKPETPPTATHIVVVHGAGGAGVLESIHSVSFESFEPAVRWVLRSAESGKGGE